MESLEAVVDAINAWIAGADKKDIYADIYRNANPIGRQPVSTSECGEVVSVARMYLRLDEVEMIARQRSGDDVEVKEMYIFADVVELEGEKLGEQFPETLLSRRRYVLLCNKMLVDTKAVQLLDRIVTGSDVPYALFDIREPSWSVSNLHPPSADLPSNFIFMHCNRYYYTDDNARTAATTLHRFFNDDDDHGHRNPIEEVLDPNRPSTVPRPPRALLQLPSILLAMESTVATSELILHFTPPTSTTARLVEAVTSHVRWLNLSLLEALKSTASSLHDDDDQQTVLADLELRMLLYRVQSLLKWPPGTLSTQVPRLQYDHFAALIERMANVAEVYDRDFKQLTLFIAHNEAQGAYLLEQNRAFADREQEMEMAHGALYSMKEADLHRALHNLNTLGGQLQEMAAEMDEARQDMEAGLKRYRDQQVARAVFSIIGAIAAIGVAILSGGVGAKLAVAGAASAVNGVTIAVTVASRLSVVLATVEKIVNLVDVVWALGSLLTGLPDLELEETPLPELPSAAEWHIFENEIEAIAADMPTEVSEVPVWKAKCKNVAALGREMTMQCVVAHELRYDIETHRLMAEVARAHAERLTSLQTTMDLTDYQRMATEMDMRTTRLTLGLFKVLSLKNAAMLYKYLLPPTPLYITSASLTMSNVRSLLIYQEATAIAALNDLGIPTNQTITYLIHDIPIGLLLDGHPWDFDISTTNIIDFPSHWRRVRISHLQLRFTGPHLPSTNTGVLYALLESGSTFFDRGRQLYQPLEYEANVPIAYQYAYDLHTGHTTLSNQPSPEFANHFMRMTPFTQWRLRLPLSALENQGLTFPTAVPFDPATIANHTAALDATTQVSISFNLTAIRSIDEHAVLKEGSKKMVSL